MNISNYVGPLGIFEGFGMSETPAKPVLKTCQWCKGGSQSQKKACPKCGGTGKVKQCSQ